MRKKLEDKIKNNFNFVYFYFYFRKRMFKARYKNKCENER